jgi:hypothetical protein
MGPLLLLRSDFAEQHIGFLPPCTVRLNVPAVYMHILRSLPNSMIGCLTDLTLWDGIDMDPYYTFKYLKNVNIFRDGHRCDWNGSPIGIGVPSTIAVLFHRPLWSGLAKGTLILYPRSHHRRKLRASSTSTESSCIHIMASQRDNQRSAVSARKRPNCVI